MEIEKLKSTEYESQPPYYMALGLHSYGGRILTTDNTDIDQLTVLHSKYSAICTENKSNEKKLVSSASGLS